MDELRALAQPVIRQALREDIGSGDVTVGALIPPARRIEAVLIAKAPGVVAGLEIARWVFTAVKPSVRFTAKTVDGRTVRRGQTLATLEGSASVLLSAERTALNLLGHLSGIATLTRRFVEAIDPFSAAIMDTRKTLPGLRALEKYAVRAGGGRNHRMGLHDAVLIKTNHIDILRQETKGVSRILVLAVERARRAYPKLSVTVEVRDLEEFRQALDARPDVILLDNWRIPEMRKAVRLRAGRKQLLLEVSGGVTLKNVRAIAATGVERISIGRLTHSAPVLDVSLRVIP